MYPPINAPITPPIIRTAKNINGYLGIANLSITNISIVLTPP